MLMKKSALVVLGTSALACAAIPAQAQDAGQTQEDSFIEAIKAGKVLADIRVRYEGVDDDIHKNAKGMTIRTRLGYQTGSMAGFKLLGEFTDTHTLLGISDYFPQQPASDNYATIADPTGTQLNRAVISYEAWDSGWVGVGRQRIILDNARWVGNVGWRQKEQTYDAGSVDFNIGDSWQLSYDYMTRVNGVTEQLVYDASNNIFRAAFSGWNLGTVVGYGYFLKNDETKDVNNTVGLRFTGSTQQDDLNWMYTAEIARQRAEFDQPRPGGDDFDAGYYNLIGGVGFKNMTIKAGFEVLGSDGGDYGLQTPLATKFAFNGWADMFLATPDGGLRDASIDFGADWAGLKWGAIYHDYRADKGSDRYGSELDFLVSKTFNKYYSVGARYADYRADDFSEDRKKFWVWFDFKY